MQTMWIYNLGDKLNISFRKKACPLSIFAHVHYQFCGYRDYFQVGKTTVYSLVRMQRM